MSTVDPSTGVTSVSLEDVPQEYRGFGIDVGGSGIKGGLVDLRTGQLIGERYKILTPKPATPEPIADVVAEIVGHFGWDGPVGITLPSVVQKGEACTAANIDPQWIGTDVVELFSSRLGDRAVTVLNDADAAGLAEIHYGAAKEHDGCVLLLTFGTGIGSALIQDGTLVPNTELGHFEVNGKDSELTGAAAVRERDDLSWKQWAQNVSTVLQSLEKFLWPTVIIAGGGVSRKSEKWFPYVECRTPLVPAVLRNVAGIAGAAWAAREGIQP